LTDYEVVEPGCILNYYVTPVAVLDL